MACFGATIPQESDLPTFGVKSKELRKWQAFSPEERRRRLVIIVMMNLSVHHRLQSRSLLCSFLDTSCSNKVGTLRHRISNALVRAARADTNCPSSS